MSATISPRSHRCDRSWRPRRSRSPGAAATPGNVGRAVLANIIGGGFQGVVTPVNRAGGVVCSMRAARSLGELEVAPELVIIAAAGDERARVRRRGGRERGASAARSPGRPEQRR